MADDARDIRLDNQAIVALAHPLRSRLLGTLRLRGPATATELAGQLDTNTGATSYHLRRLEAVGLVEDTGEGVGKRRLWAAASRSHSYVGSDFADDPDAGAAFGWLRRHYVQQMGERLTAFMDAEHDWPGRWRDIGGLGDDKVLVTPDQAEQLWDEIAAVITRYHRAGEGDPSATDLLVWTAMAPVDPADPPEQPA